MADFEKPKCGPGPECLESFASAGGGRTHVIAPADEPSSELPLSIVADTVTLAHIGKSLALVTLAVVDWNMFGLYP